MKFVVFFCLTILILSTHSVAQVSYQEWADMGQPELTDNGPGVADPADRGGLTTFADRTSFDATAGTLPLEDFEGGLSAGVATCTEPVNSSSNDACFVPGDLIAGFNISSSGGGGLVVLDDGFLGPTTDVIGANLFAEFTVVIFDAPDVTAIALDAFSGNPGAGDVTVRAFDAGSNSLGSVVVTTSANNVSEFVGFTSPVPIASIEIEGAGDSGELIDNLAFGAPVSLPETQPVPTLNAIGILAAIVLLMLVAGLALRTRFQ